MQALLVSSGEKGRAMLTELMRGAGVAACCRQKEAFA